MVAVSTTQASGLSLLQMPRGPSDTRNVLSFLRSDIFGVSSKRIHNVLVKTFAGSTGLKETYTATFEATFDRLTKWVTLQAGAEHANSEEQRITTLRNAATNALVDVIMTNRASFPPEGFTIRTEYPGGAWSITEIPPGRTTPPGYKTTVETIDAAIAAQFGAQPKSTQAPAVSPPGTETGQRAAWSLVAAALLGLENAAVKSENAAVKMLDTALDSNRPTRERTEAAYHAS